MSVGMENGVNVMCIPARDAYSFSLNLTDVMFTKAEFASSKKCAENVTVITGTGTRKKKNVDAES